MIGSQEEYSREKRHRKFGGGWTGKNIWLSPEVALCPGGRALNGRWMRCKPSSEVSHVSVSKSFYLSVCSWHVREETDWSEGKKYPELRLRVPVYWIQILTLLLSKCGSHKEMLYLFVMRVPSGGQ